MRNGGYRIVCIGLPGSGNRIISNTLRVCEGVATTTVKHLAHNSELRDVFEYDIIIEPWRRDEERRHATVKRMGSNLWSLEPDQIEKHYGRIELLKKTKDIHRVCLEDLIKSRGESFPDIGIEIDWHRKDPYKKVFCGPLLTWEEYQKRKWK